jgi:hypothetical protein
MSSVNENLSADAAFQAELEESTRRYLDRRDSIGRLEDRSHPGGSERIKCLHAHTAHQLVTGDNPVGRAVLNELNWSDPGDPCV